ncbi:MAG: flagellar hook-associated protein FlgL, partial [Clostridiales bacterium]|nr:flagellar hook-associated protein FlgL [Clostridiales bacterium]
YQKNVDDAVSWLENTESSVENINKAVHRIRDIAVQGANGVLTAEETQKIQQELKHLKSQIISIANTTYGSSYIFSGKKIDQPLLDEFGNYNVDLIDYLNPHIVDDKKDVQVGTGENIGVNTLGFEIFEGYEKPVIYSNVVGNNDIVLTLPNGEEIDTKTSNPEKALEKLKEMSQEYGSPLKGYEFEKVDIEELNNNNRLATRTYIKATPTDVLVVDEKTRPAVWDTGNITVPEFDDGNPATFTFMGVTIDIVKGDTTEADPKNLNARGATIVVEEGISSEDLAKKIEGALQAVSEESGSKIEGFTFEAIGEGLRVVAPETAGGRYNKETFGGTLGIAKEVDEQLVLSGKGESKSVAKGQKAGIIQLIEKLEKEMMEGNNEEIGNLLDTIDIYHRTILTAKSEIGAKVNRMKLVSDRIEGDIINFRELQSQLEDADMAETLMELMNEENVYRSALAMGARIIQPSLLDFLR